MIIDSAFFELVVDYCNGSRLVLQNDDILEFDYIGHHYRGHLKSVRKNWHNIGFILYVYANTDADQRLRVYDVPLWEIQNLKKMEEK